MSRNRRKNRQMQSLNNNSGMMVSRQESFSGPLPPPKVLEQFEEIVPGSAKVIIDMAEKQSEHRRKLETQVISSGTKNSKLGLWFGLIIGLVGLISATILGVYGQQIIGSVMGVGTLVSLVGTFVYGSQQRREERQKSRDES